MAKMGCDFRYLLLPAALLFIYVQMRLFTTQSEYADRLASAIESESHCTSQMKLLIDQISSQQGRIVALEEEKKRRQDECKQLKFLVEDFQKQGLQKVVTDVQVPVAAVVIMACNRADYLERTVESVTKYQSSVASKFPLFVSQKGRPNLNSIINLNCAYLHFLQHLDSEPLYMDNPGELIAYYKIARHYKWALDQLFYKHKFNRVIILEDDMEIAPDFFQYFEAAASLLDKDKSIMAVSSWNDNGQKQFVHDPSALYRSDFFPGLGWMLSKGTWDELSPKWPKAYPDDWLRLEENHKGRQFLRPEVCRTYNFGEVGSSLGQFYKQYLEPIKLNDVEVITFTVDISYLQDKYPKHFAELVTNAKPVYGKDAVLKAFNIVGDVRIQYKDEADFANIARKFGIFEEWKDGVPRTAYKGVVVFRHQTSRRIFLVGSDSLRQLGIQDA
ncbi:Alpha-1,3-mannosyl-glycoprotein 2-beta-N-acetylglucosaminyltransferase [Linum perenne]